ncbi:programmed cell death protein 7 [Microplitis demolitor]|uniref:programmed cell death protein 7 n=1 Tax=Microplitis demolitor TaxID=69319 RepID=UPI00235B6B19|nr:programmed cell death protein 7 [Microplitis demolitor]
MYNNSNYLSQNIQYENMPQFYANYNYSNLYEQPQVNRYNDSSGFNKTFEYNQSDVTSNQLVIDVYQREKDTELINNFIDENSNLKADKKFNHKEKNKKLGITQIKSLLSSINKLNVNLKEEISSLEEEKFKLDTEELNEKLQKCMRIKMEVEKLSLMIREDDVILKFKKLIDQRKKKRMREKKLRAKWKASKLLDAERRDRLHAAADAWIRDKQDVIEREKQEENLRKDADMILSDIRNKRSDARKYLSVLNELKNLRKVKSANARARGEKLSVAADQAFENIIVQLIEQWSKLDREYSIEEHGLKLMLQTDNEKVITRQKKNNFDDWEVAIFGRKLSPVNNGVKNDFNKFVMIRFMWDRYINYHGEGRRIPIGWVMPEFPSSAAWQKCLKKI